MVDEDLTVGVDIGSIHTPFGWNFFFGVIDEGVEEGEIGGREGVREDEIVIGVEEGEGLGGLVRSEGRIQFYGFLGLVILQVDDPIEVAYLPLICGILPRPDLSYLYCRSKELMWGIGVGVSRACWKVGNRIA